MKDNSFAYVIIALIIIIGSIFIGITQKEGKEEYNIVYTINGKKYEAIIYTNNTVKIAYQNCIGDNCYIENKKYKYEQEKMEEYRKKIEENSNNFEEYDESKKYTNIIYDVNSNKALYDKAITNDYQLTHIVEKILTGNY